MEAAELFPRYHHTASSGYSHAAGSGYPHTDLCALYPAAAAAAGGGNKFQPREEIRLWLLQIRSRQSIQRLVQLGSGLLVLLIVLVCIVTLLTHEATSTSTPRRSSGGAYPTTRLKLAESAADVDGVWSSVPSAAAAASSSGDSVMLSRLVNKPLREPVPLSDVFISVKTSAKFHKTRLAVILKTWFNLAPKNTYLFTDAADSGVSGRVGADHLVVTSCPSDHSRQALCCKMQAEFDHFLRSDKRWFCHFDDDQYVNVAGLLRKLGEFPADLAWYLGKNSIDRPLEILHRDTQQQQQQQRSIKFWFATGGAGFCLSRPLADKMAGLAAEGRFTAVGDQMRLPDDVTMGYVVEQLAGVAMTRLDQFHSHLEPLRLVTNLADQISFSYSEGGQQPNLVEVEGLSLDQDPTRFLTIHCTLYPGTSWCTDQQEEDS